MAVIVLSEGTYPAPSFGRDRSVKPVPQEPRVIKPGRAEPGGEERVAQGQARAGGGGEGQAGTAGTGAAGAVGIGPGQAAGLGTSASGFRLVYRKGTPLDLSRNKADPLAELARPERYQARPDINFSKYIRPNPLKPDTSPPGGGGGGAAAAAVESKRGPVSAVAATPAGGVNVPDNVRRFDFRPWANEVAARIQKNWSLLPYGGGSWKGEVGLLIMISKTGEVLGAEIKVSSNIELLDQVALSAVQTSSPLPPLPADFPNSSLEMYLVFKYGY